MAEAQNLDPELYQKHGRFVADLGAPVLEWLEPQPGERILDLGCGDGALAARLMAIGCQVVGIDAIPELVGAARALGVDAHVVDAHALSYDGEFDAVFSNAALHWMKRPAEVIAGVWRALVPGGRFVGEMGGEGNIAAIRGALYTALGRRGINAAAHDPWYFPGEVEYASRLAEKGFHVTGSRLIPRPTPVADMADWLYTFAGCFLNAVSEAERPALVDELHAALRPALQGPDGSWTLDYVRLRFRAIRPPDTGAG